MGWAARANPTVRDGKKPARVTPREERLAGALEVFVPFKAPGEFDSERVRVGLMRPQAGVLNEDYFFDGRSIRRMRRPADAPQQ